MKKTSKFLAMLLMGAVSMGFTSCSDDDDNSDNNVVISTALMQSTAQTYIDDVVYPTYTALANNAQTLADACATLYAHAQAGTLAQTDIGAACEAFKNARREWERSEAFLYGAASDNDIDPHIDSWPLDHDELVECLTSSNILTGIHGSNAGQFLYENNSDFQSVIGFHGLEFVLFRNGANRTVADFQANDTYYEGLSVSGLDELAFAAAVSQDVRNMTFLLEYGWLGGTLASSHYNYISNNASWVINALSNKGLSPMNTPYGEYLLAATTSTGYFTTWQETMENILVGGCSNICQEVYTQKLGQAYRVATGNGGTTEDGEAESIDYIESPYSMRSFIDYQDNIYSIKNVLYGTRDITATSPVANSMMAIMRDNYSGYQNLLSALNGAISALESAKNSGTPFVKDPKHAQVKTCIDAVNALDDELNKAGTWFRSVKLQ